MIDLDPRSCAEVSRLLREYLPGQEVCLVGSRARGGAKRFADIDLLVMNQEPLPARTRALLKTAFEESDLPFKVDLVEWAGLSRSFRDRLKRDQVPWPEEVGS